jgi:hypothetical protein
MNPRARHRFVFIAAAEGRISCVLLIGALFLFFAFSANAQTSEPILQATPTPEASPTPEVIPTLDMSRMAAPPAKELTKEERDLLTANSVELKKYTKVALELMEARMKRAEEADAKDDFETMFRELGAFHALIDHSLELLLKRHGSGKKAFSEFKRYELGVRGFIPRMELIRRDLPIRYEYYIRLLIRHLREAREKAIDPMFTDSVVNEKRN